MFTSSIPCGCSAGVLRWMEKILIKNVGLFCICTQYLTLYAVYTNIIYFELFFSQSIEQTGRIKAIYRKLNNIVFIKQRNETQTYRRIESLLHNIFFRSYLGQGHSPLHCWLNAIVLSCCHNDGTPCVWCGVRTLVASVFFSIGKQLFWMNGNRLWL